MATFIIPAAGRATRLRPITSNVSKAMVTVGGKPTIAHVLDHIGVGHEVIIVEGQFDDLRNFVKPRYPYVKFVQQDVQRGELDAAAVGLGVAKGKGPVVIWNGDTIVEDEFEYDVDGPLVQDVEDQSPWLMTDGKQFFDKPTSNIGPGFAACVGVFRFKDAAKLRNACALSFSGGCYNIIGAFNLYRPEDKRWQIDHVERWYDVGNLDNYHRARAELMTNTGRSFNDISVDTYYNTVTKVGRTLEASDKIDAEALWYTSLRGKQRLFAPQLINHEHGMIVLSLEPGTTVAELLLYHDLPVRSWVTILSKIFDVMHEVFYEPFLPWPDSLEYMWIDKNVERVKEYAPEFIPFVERVGRELVESAHYSRTIHGDLATHNVLYDAFTGKLTLIDPRGSFLRVGTEGDQQYDICKLWEDIYWGLTQNLAGRRTVVIDPIVPLEQLTKQYGYDVDLMKAGGLLLLLTAVPFHEDNPLAQQTFIDTARRTILD